MQGWPQWWNYEIVISPHVVERMQERGFSEVDLRAMLDDATGYRESAMPGRFCIEMTWLSEPWEVVVEPDELEQSLIVVTAYRIE
ncbi:MAG: DUF4258 domain-containing protein [Phycisphaerales bacterium]|nr:DUF4258 domain-containing protein [Phycisphaerales bacterium]